MDTKIAFMLLILVIAGCTTYQYEPTGEVVEEIGEEFEETPFEEGDEFEVVVESETEDGQGIVTVKGETVLIPGGRTGRRLRIVIKRIGDEQILADILSELPEEEVPEEEIPEEEPISVEEGEADVVASEGDLIDLKTYVLELVQDPDGDELDLGFTSPFDPDGVWQTEEGDAGFYSVIVTATDNKGSFVTKQLTVKVIVENEPPVIDIPDTLEFDESDLIELKPDVSDADGDSVIVSYSGWMGEDTYQTTYDDAGKYTVIITADDSKEKTKKSITILVEDVNREPMLIVLSGVKVEVAEGGLVQVEAEASDPDNDAVTIEFSAPLDAEGMWQTQVGDAGTYEVDVIASDGVNTVTHEILIEVMRKNQAPVIESLSANPAEVVLKKPGDQAYISIDVVASDPDEDELEITYSGYMDSPEKTVKYGDAGGLKTVTVTVSDGLDSVSQDVTFTMNNWPCFDCQ